MSRKKKNQQEVAEINRRFMHYLTKKVERLTILLDPNLENHANPSEDDVVLLKEEFDAFDRSTLTWVKQEDTEGQKVTQKEIFTD